MSTNIADSVGDNVVRNLCEQSADQREAFIDSFDYVLTDCDGTIWNIDSPIEGAEKGIAALQRAGKRIVYLSNNAVRNADEYELKFKESRIEASFLDVYHPGVATIDYLRHIRFDGLIYLIGSSSVKSQLTAAGFQVCTGSWQPIAENLRTLVGAIRTGRQVGAVIIDWDFNLTLKQLLEAQMYLRQPDCLFITMTTEMTLGSRVKFIGPGPFWRILEEATQRQAIVLGKPGQELCDVVKRKFGIGDARRVLFVGDTLEQDIGFGRLCGFQTLAVLTGVCTEADFQPGSSAGPMPDYYLPRFEDFAAVCDGLSAVPSSL